MIRTRTVVNVYCDGATHVGLEFTVYSLFPKQEIHAYIRRAGWTINRQGQTFCPQHKGGKK